MTVLARIRPAVAWLGRQAFRFLTASYGLHDPEADLIVAFALRCQHCAASIELAKSHPSERRWVVGHDGPLFRDESGRITCDTEPRIPHKPMPSISRLREDDR